MAMAVATRLGTKLWQSPVTSSQRRLHKYSKVVHSPNLEREVPGQAVVTAAAVVVTLGPESRWPLAAPSLRRLHRYSKTATLQTWSEECWAGGGNGGVGEGSSVSSKPEL